VLLTYKEYPAKRLGATITIYTHYHIDSYGIQRFPSEHTASITYHIKHNVYYTEWRNNAKGITIEQITQRFVSFEFALICFHPSVSNKNVRVWRQLEVVDRVNTSLLATSKCQIYVIENSTMHLFRISQQNNDNNKKTNTTLIGI
jgi:hypothetical protein